MSQPANNQGHLDAIAVVLSGVCMLHCLALPLLLTISPILNVTLLSETVFHVLLLVFILPTSVIALTIGCRSHKDKITLVLGALGLSILTITAFFGHQLVGLTGERILTSFGGLILAGSHIQNYRCCRRDNCNHDH
ncbi:MAG: MerC domain-containing protein [Pseudomonadales bacterium]|nr:MerC domain-containing protein [Pseudomonadales bacterium]